MMLRRDFLLSSAIFSIAPNVGAKTSDQVAYIASAKSPLGEVSFVCLDNGGNTLTEYNIPSRGHSFAYSGVHTKHIAAIARRPADFCLILDNYGHKVTEFSSADSRHFYGHGVYSPDGDYLYLTENDFSFIGSGDEGSRGVIGVYEVASGYKRITEFDSAGIGPHEIALSTDGKSLIVANGGIKTHPESGRKKLNLESMKPNLAFLDRKTGQLNHKVGLDSSLATNSIRHITVSDNGDVYVALQQQVKSRKSCLVAYYDPVKRSLNPMPLPSQYGVMLNNYVGDISLDSDQKTLALTSPYGNVMLLIDLASKHVQAIKVNDVCGISRTKINGQFVATNGEGRVILVNQSSHKANVELLVNHISFNWDNHILTLI